MTEPLSTKPRIVAIGVGGAGCNAVNNMIASGLGGVKFIVANRRASACCFTRRAEDPLGHHPTEARRGLRNPKIAGCGRGGVDEIAAHCRAHMLFYCRLGGGTARHRLCRGAQGPRSSHPDHCHITSRFN
jgi:cell division protein FtsZ